MKNPNLCLLSKEEQEAIELEKNLWLKASKIWQKMNNQEIRKHLASLPKEESEDLRIRLNKIRGL